ncbi:sensor histidine kinase [Stieleria varia]|uniref:histidine kinase n=1 Tax=Stieleria varia TaxID=2528005 RepID=A0A5C6AZM3_9BACT|nr:ATP-binding protein [Stieleria varia]TWU04476.1 Phytochrome-like protein cph1 [Stieleria varia]
MNLESTQRSVQTQKSTSEDEASSRSRALLSVMEDLQAERESLKAEIQRRCETEAALRQSEHRTALIIETALDGVITVNDSGHITGWNDQAAVIFGWSREQASGMRISEIILLDEAESRPGSDSGDHLHAGRSDLLNRRIERTAIRSDGSRFPAELSMSVLPLDAGFEFSCFVRDITNRKNAERLQLEMQAELERRVIERTQELERANERLRNSNEELQQFAYVASHDLQTPLRGIMGFAQFLESDYTPNLDEQGLEYINRIVASAKRMQTLIQDLLKFSRVQSLASELTPVWLDKPLSAAVAVLESEMEKCSVELISEDLPRVLADAAQIEQLFRNLIENSIKYRHPERRPQIRVSAILEGDRWTISIADNGIGIDPKHFKRIFEIFKRLHAEGEYSGNGIGLAVCRRIVLRHGGRIWADESDVGALIKFTLHSPKSLSSESQPSKSVHADEDQ